MKLGDIWRALMGAEATPLGSLAEQRITSVIVDSRAAGPESLFIALRGERTDGHLYIADAFARGAIVAIAEERAIDLGVQAAFVRVGEILPPTFPRSRSFLSCQIA